MTYLVAMTLLQETLTSKVMEFFTIGVYNSTESEFFKNLTDNNIDTFCDIRQRRGVRGSKYSFVNSKKLQFKLEKLNITYKHIIDLAPTTEIRDLQKIADAQKNQLKRDRKELGVVFKSAYKDKILRKFDFHEFISDLKQDNAKRVVLFCVEELPKACHRSVVTKRLENEFNFNIIHL